MEAAKAVISRITPPPRPTNSESLARPMASADESILSMESQFLLPSPGGRTTSAVRLPRYCPALASVTMKSLPTARSSPGDARKTSVFLPPASVTEKSFSMP